MASNTSAPATTGIISVDKLIQSQLPIIPLNDSKQYYVASASSESTKQQDPLIKTIPSKVFSSLQEAKALEMLKASQYYSLPLDSYLFLHNESDVVHAAAVYLVNPVNHALRLCLPSSGGAKATFRCQSEFYAATDSRVDLIWRFWEHDVCIAVLEFKRPFTIFPEDWAPASAGKKVVKNALVLSQQAVKYRHAGAKYVVLFDWRNMVVLDFADDENDNVPGYTCISERAEGDKGRTFRNALFSVLLLSTGRAGKGRGD